mgnify:CR=1 FL=1
MSDNSLAKIALQGEIVKPLGERFFVTFRIVESPEFREGMAKAKASMDRIKCSGGMVRPVVDFLDGDLNVGSIDVGKSHERQP